MLKNLRLINCLSIGLVSLMNPVSPIVSSTINPVLTYNRLSKNTVGVLAQLKEVEGKQDIKQVKQDIKQDIKQELKQDIKQELKQDIKQELNQEVIDAVYLNQQGYDLYQRGQWDEAIAIFNEALGKFRKHKARGGEGNSLNYLGQVYLVKGEYEQGLSFFQQALKIFQELSLLPNGEAQYVGYTWQYIGETYGIQNQHNEGLNAYQEALRIFNKLLNNEPENDSFKTSKESTLEALGSIYFKTGQMTEALKVYQDVFSIQQEQTDKIGQAHTLNNMGVIYGNTGQYAKALDSYEKALGILQELGPNLRFLGEESSIYNNMSSLFFSLGEPAKAVEYSDRAQKVYQRWQSEGSTLPTEKSLELLQDNLGNPLMNPQFVNQSLAVRSSIGETSNPNLVVTGEAVTLNNLGQIYLSLGQPDKALALYQKALKTYQKVKNQWGEGVILQQLGQTYEVLGDFDRALQNYQKALSLYEKIGDEMGISIVNNNLGSVWRKKGDLGQALSFYNKALTGQKKIGEQRGIAVTLQGIGRILLEENKAGEAIKILSEAIETFEALRPGLNDASKVALFEQGKLSYQLLQRAYIAQNQPEKALEVAERGRARAFVELLAARGTQNSNPKPLDIKQIKSIAQQQQATLVEYSIIGQPEQQEESQLYIWVVKPTGEVNFRSSALQSVLEGTTLAQYITDARNNLFARQGKTQNSILNELHNALISPIADLLPSEPDEPVIIIPQDTLFLLPFPALIDNTETPLIEKHTLLTAPAISIL